MKVIVAGGLAVVALMVWNGRGATRLSRTAARTAWAERKPDRVMTAFLVRGGRLRRLTVGGMLD